MCCENPETYYIHVHTFIYNIYNLINIIIGICFHLTVKFNLFNIYSYHVYDVLYLPSVLRSGCSIVYVHTCLTLVK